MFSKKNKILRVALHILFWIFVFAGFMFLYGYRNENYLVKLILQLRFGVVEILYVYFVIYFLIPRFLLQKRTVLFFIYFTLSFTTTILFEQYLMMIWGNTKITLQIIPDSFSSPSFYWLALENLFVIVLASAIKLVKQWYQNQREKDELKRKNLETELQLLKSQINPHFLFNTLNNINSLIFIDQQKTYETVIKLSELLRYMIYDTKAEKVLLKDEISVITNYVELQRIRIKKTDFIELEINGNLNSIRVAPMLFIPFVENVFKHGKKDASEAPGIIIRLEKKDNKLLFTTRNYIKEKQHTENGGIGIENAKRRLHLIYPDLHELEILNQDGVFSVKLTLEIL
ncbi:MAG: hypothetical protein C0599_04520 [Salinivirgaceae bacterium]|nr:MAG: hypothetical protein C0599_04520 [Salinivirgaceae bacterium]